MSNVFTLEAILEETVSRYAPVVIDLGGGEKVELKNILRLGEKVREKVLSVIDEVNDLELEDDEDEEKIAEWSDEVCNLCSQIFKLITKSPKKLLSKLNHKDPLVKANLHTGVLARWAGGSQLGEAGPSPS